MSGTDERKPADQGAPPAPSLLAPLREHFRQALLSVLVLTLLTGVVFPLLLALLARSVFRSQADGSLVPRDGIVVGSDLLGQKFSGPGYCHSRPSAAGDGYDATASGGTNLGPANPKLREDVRRRAED